MLIEYILEMNEHLMNRQDACHAIIDFAERV